ncbi:hypothetical protein ACTXGQ_05035 [Marinobacter sp. 1Y8]
MSFSVRPATPGDNAAILDLLARNHQPGRVQLAFERYPDYFHGAGVTCETPDVYVLELHAPDDPAPVRIVGVFNIGSRRVFVNGESKQVRYAHDLRLDHAVRGGEALATCYRYGRELMAEEEWMQTVILSENAAYLDSVSKTREGMPDMYPAGEIETSLITGGGARSVIEAELEIRPASRADVPVMQAFVEREGSRRQFFPHYCFELMLNGDDYYRGLRINQFWLAFRGDHLVGMVGVWDQKDFRQTRVAGYQRGLALARPAHNAWCRVGGGLRLPAVGDCFHYLMLHSILVENSEETVCLALLQRLQKSFGRYYDALICGFFTDDPLNRVPARFQRMLLKSRHFLMNWTDDPRPSLDASRIPYADVARL